MARAMKVVKAMKAQQVIKAEMAVKKRKRVAVGKFTKLIAASKRKMDIDANAAELESVAKKAKVNPQDEKTLVAERKVALTAMKLADLEHLHKTNGLGTEPVKEVVARTKEDLDATQLPDLKKLCEKKDLKVGGTKGDLVQRLLDHAKEILKSSMIQGLCDFEANARKEALEEARAHAVKVREVLSKLKKEAVAKSNEDLKELLVGYGLKSGGSKDEKVDRIVTRQREDGEVEKCLAAMARETRKQNLLSMNLTALMEMCGKSKEVLDDRLVKEIIVDRLLLSEAKSTCSTKQSPGPK